MPGSRNQRKRDRLARQAAIGSGYKLIPHGASDMTPCGCSTHVWAETEAVALRWCVELQSGIEVYHVICDNCGLDWTWRIPPLPGKYSHLCVDGTHPEIRALRAANLAFASLRSGSRPRIMPDSISSRRTKARH